MLKRSSNKFIFTLSVLSVLGLSSCTSELPKIESESLQETVFSLDSFSKKINVRLEDQINNKSLTKLDLVQTKTDYKKVTLKYISGNDELKDLVNDITLSVPNNTPSKIELNFELYDGHVVAKTAIPLSINKSLISSDQSLNLFEYGISGHGIKRRVKNANDEETRNIEFHLTPKAQATHIQISSPFLETVVIGGLDSLDEGTKNRIFNKSFLQDNIWSQDEIIHLLKNLDDKQSINANIIDSTKNYALTQGKNNLLIQEIISSSELSEQEKENIKLGNNTIALQKCRKKISKVVNKQECYMRAISKISANDASISAKQNFQGKELSTIELKSIEKNSSIVWVTGNELNDVDSTREDFLIDTEKMVINKNDIDFDSEYIYLPSTHGTPRDVVNAAPFFQGEEKIVKIRMTADGLLIYQEDPDKRFKDNEHNESPVLLITGEHIDQSCKEREESGACKDRNLQKKNWNEKQFFKPSLDKFKHLQTNEVNLFTLNESCVYEVDSKMSHAEIKNGVINVEQIKTYKVAEQSQCMIELFYDDNLKSSSFTVKHFFSLVRLKDLASMDYQAFNYPQENHQAFGFFKDQSKQKAQDYTSARERTKYLLNRFNPNKKKLIYKLSEEFGRAENKYILDATHDVINKLNNSLKKANTNLQIELEEPSKIYPGDLRNNSLVLITDPLANGLLGYGPSVSNPRTGEILQAHTNMYLGVLRTGTRRTYKYMEEMAKQKPIEVNQSSTSVADVSKKSAQDFSFTKYKSVVSISQVMSEKTENALGKFRLTGDDHSEDFHQHNQLVKSHSSIKEKDYMPLVSNRNDLDNIFGSLHAGDFSNLEKEASLFEKTLDLYAKNNAFHEEAMNYNALGKVIIPEIKKIKGIVKSNGHLLEWEKLSETQREKAIKIIIAHGYKTTLAHELGHNLGLRHNFKGSYDKANFYKSNELPEGSKHLSPKYSSIMDYGASELNELPVLGKYDIAALRYGYANEIEMNDGSIQKVNGDDLINLLPRKKYKFCTDENAGGSIECNRFDEGSTNEEIVDHYIRNYKNSYLAANLRDGRESFKSYQLPQYIQYKFYSMKNIRDSLDKYNFYRSIFGQDALNGQCPEQYPICVEINDVYRATLKAGNFFTEIISTPDLTCVVDNGTEKSQKKFTDLYDKIKYQTSEDIITSCFHPDIQKALENGESIVAEGGKLINDLSGTHSLIRSQYDIDVRGIWADKLLAIKMLFGKMSGSDQTAGLSPLSFIEHPTFSNDLFGYISHLTLGEALPKPIKFKDASGKDIEVNYVLNEDEYLASRPTWFPTLVFGFPPYSGADLNELILKNIYKSNKTTDPNLRDHTKRIREMISIYKKSYISENTSDEALTYTTGSDKFVAGTENQIAYTMINVMNNAEELDSIPNELAQIVLDNRVNRETPSSLSKEEKDFFELETELMEAIIQYFKGYPAPKTPMEYMQMVKNPKIALALVNAQNLGLTKLIQIYSDKQELYQSKIECKDARNIIDPNEEVCQAYDLLWTKDDGILYLKGQGELETRAEAFKTRIKKLPSQNSSEYNFVEQLMEQY